MTTGAILCVGYSPFPIDSRLVLLRSAGYEVIRVASENEALCLMSFRNISLVIVRDFLTDWKLIRCLRRLRPSVPIMAINVIADGTGRTSARGGKEDHDDLLNRVRSMFLSQNGLLPRNY